MLISNHHKNEEEEPEKLYQISKDELFSLLCYTVCVCMYFFCILLICRRIFLMRPALQEASRKIAMVAVFTPPAESEEK